MARGELHQIGEVAEAVGLSLRTIRHYEEVGLVPPSDRTEGGFRLYSADDIERLQLVKQLKPLHFSLEEMREILDTRDALAGDDIDDVQREELGERMKMFAAVADQRCEDLRDQLAGAEASARMLHRSGSSKGRTRTSR